MAQVFRKNNFICLIEKNDDDEPEEHFIERGNFVASQKPRNEQEYTKSIIYSYVYINNKYLKCQYNLSVMHELNQMKANL